MTSLAPPVQGAEPAALTVLSSARWPATPPEGAPTIPGFIASSFSPTVAALAERCLAGWYPQPPLPPAAGARTAIILTSVRGDLAIARAIADSVDAGRRMSPLLFFQSVANAVLGHVAARWGIGGPVVCTSPVADPAADALALAAALLADGDADTALVVHVEPAWSGDEHDTGAAWLVQLPAAGPGLPGGPGPQHPGPPTATHRVRADEGE